MKSEKTPEKAGETPGKRGEPFFEEVEENDGRGIVLKEEKTIQDLIGQFCGYLALDILLIFANKRSTEALKAR